MAPSQQGSGSFKDVACYHHFKFFLDRLYNPGKVVCGNRFPVRNCHFYTLSFANNQVVVGQCEEDFELYAKKIGSTQIELFRVNLGETEYL